MTKEFKAENYDIIVKEIQLGDGETMYEASVKELPSLYDYGHTEDVARKLILESIEMSYEYHISNGMDFPSSTR